MFCFCLDIDDDDLVVDITTKHADQGKIEFFVFENRKHIKVVEFYCKVNH